jgi:preprotein translocase subunit SecA
MITNFLEKLFGTKKERDVKEIAPLVDVINEHYNALSDLSEDALKNKTVEFKARLANGESLDDILPEAFATVKETCRRLSGKTWKAVGQDIEWNMIPYDVQLIGGIVLHRGKIAEMATGEGKTLVATMPVYLNALSGDGVHIVTVNDYLAQRDAEWVGEIYRYLGLTVGVLLNQMPSDDRRKAYNCDVTFGTNSEFGFDYLRDNMAGDTDDIVQVRGHNYCIIDEVDSILIDEARTPLIISGPVSRSTHKYDELKRPVERLVAKQRNLVSQLIDTAVKRMDENGLGDYESGELLLAASRGMPKNKKLLKLFKEQGVRKMVFDVESDYLRDKKLHEIDERLYFSVDEKSHVIDLTEIGREALSPDNPEMFTLPDLGTGIAEIEEDDSLSKEEIIRRKSELNQSFAEKSEKIHNISQLLRAYTLYEKDVEYVVQEDKVQIVDEFTGRIMYGRRYSDGLHQAIEAKENVKIERETQTLATITIQNYFRMYNKLSGMTGTAETEAGEFWDIYKLDVVVIPTNRPIQRDDMEDVIYRTKREKFNAILDEIEHVHKSGRPILVGTISVEISETLARMLKRKGIPHNVLNAKQHQKEAEIVAMAGKKGGVTIATNMAGRGTDIKLDPDIINCHEKMGVDPDDMPCGLHIVGTERHESRRIDRQLRGRSGRQGDPGSSRFFVSLEDDLMRLFGSDRMISWMDRLGAQEGEAIEASMITKAIEKAQQRVETQNFSIRKRLLEYDDVMNQQREVIYERRAKVLKGEKIRDDLEETLSNYLEDVFDEYAPDNLRKDQWDFENLHQEIMTHLFIDLNMYEEEMRQMDSADLRRFLYEKALETYNNKVSLFEDDKVAMLERWIMLSTIDEKWKDHLYEMDALREGVSLQAYGQKDPLVIYKKEAYGMFQSMVFEVNKAIITLLWGAQLSKDPDTGARTLRQPMQEIHESSDNMGFVSGQERTEIQQGAEAHRNEKKQPIKVTKKPGRNEPCHCGSGKKYKHCHGKLEQ